MGGLRLIRVEGLDWPDRTFPANNIKPLHPPHIMYSRQTRQVIYSFKPRQVRTPFNNVYETEAQTAVERPCEWKWGLCEQCLFPSYNPGIRICTS